MNDLTNKIALITGATGGMGQETAIELSREGVNLILVGRDEDKLEDLKECIRRDTGVDVSSHLLDLGTATEKEIKETVGHIDALDMVIFTAGALIPGSLEKTDLSWYEAHFNVNIRSVFLILKNLLPKLRASRGQVVIINSSIIKAAKGNLPLYTASKHALAGFTDAFRHQVNPFGIRVINIIPGKTATKMQKSLAKEMGTTYNPESMIQPVAIAYTIIHALKLPDSAEITEIHIRPMKK